MNEPMFCCAALDEYTESYNLAITIQSPLQPTALCAQSSGATDTATLMEELRSAKVLLDASRPTAVNLTWATQRVCKVAQTCADEQNTAAKNGSSAVAAVQAAVLMEAQRLGTFRKRFII